MDPKKKGWRSIHPMKKVRISLLLLGEFVFLARSSTKHISLSEDR
jgi:hypothetical protein